MKCGTCGLVLRKWEGSWFHYNGCGRCDWANNAESGYSTPTGNPYIANPEPHVTMYVEKEPQVIMSTLKQLSSVIVVETFNGRKFRDA